LIIFEYENDRRTKDNKNSLDAVLYIGRSSRGMEGQLVKWTIKGGVRGKDNGEVIHKNEK